MQDSSKKLRFLKSFIHIVNDNGWNVDSFNKTRNKLKFSEDVVKNLFPKGLDDLIFYFHSFINQRMLIAYKNKKFDKKSVRSKILNSLKIRFNILNQYRTFVKKSMIYLSHPVKQILSTKLVYKVVDFTWNTIDDKSKDINFYTKRAILATIYGGAILFWLNDKSNNLQNTNIFLEKTIMNMDLISSLKENFRKKFSNFL